MNCRTCQHELSQCLDGRLPSGRRATVMQHAAECQSCAAFWEELQQAQELILRLPRQHAGPEFRDSLWERIQSGEGTPPAVFQEPVPLATKIRYLATGAAAAALMLVAWHFATRKDTPEQSPVVYLPRETNTGAPVAPPVLGGLQPRPQPDASVCGVPSSGLLAAIEPLTPNLMAREAALQFNTQLASAKDYADRLQPRGQEPVTDHSARRLCEQAGEMTRLGRVLLDLQAHQHVWFSEPVADELKIVVEKFDERTLARREPTVAAGSIVAVLPQLQHVGRLADDIRGGKLQYSCQELDVFLSRWAQQPQVLHLLFASGMELGPLERFSMSIRQGDCGPNAMLVAPRSKLGVFAIQLMPRPK